MKNIKFKQKNIFCNEEEDWVKDSWWKWSIPTITTPQTIETIRKFRKTFLNDIGSFFNSMISQISELSYITYNWCKFVEYFLKKSWKNKNPLWSKWQFSKCKRKTLCWEIRLLKWRTHISGIIKREAIFQ